MTLQEFLAELELFASEANRCFQAAGDLTALEAARIEFLGARSGRLKQLQKSLGQLPSVDRPQAGQRFHQVRREVESAFQAAQERLADRQKTVRSAEVFDPTIPGVRPVVGHLHPITQTIDQLKEIMGRLGFSLADGPEVEDEWHNFEALNIPPDHPARDPLDNFYLAAASRLAGGAGPSMLLRSQTSTVQIRVMERQKPPVRIIAVGRVYRPDTPDQTHSPMFHQIEGLLVDRRVTMADLKSVLRMLGMSYFHGEVHIRFRPSFFPFTEPSVEIDMNWQGRWIEMGGAGMVDPNVLRAVGYDPEEVSGFAFGLGIERLCMRQHGIDDIREFYRNDVRFLRQF
ncbi:MAG TPA: phenylalanine--tRNA ligase subunit alpha [Thermoguttaceae bacterium]|nr:phenylalanine--tRNA ligase subunit alpha [Thermoguttaceae bacterium]HPP52494.1 phenylalanine--tRNA ligase subunit alpha [Thermoguttaceae bacterium]